MLNHTSSSDIAAKGAYVIRQFGETCDVTLLATGTEVSLAIGAAEALSADGIGVAVVSMPSWGLFEQQLVEHRASVLEHASRVAIEAAGKFGWTRYVDSEDDMIGMDGFGASGPADVLYRDFGITAEAVADRARARIGVRD